MKPVRGSQASAVHGLKSSVGTGSCVTPRTGSHASRVQGLLSSILGGDPATHCPAPSHVSTPSQTLSLSQLLPRGTADMVHRPSTQSASVQGSSLVQSALAWHSVVRV